MGQIGDSNDKGKGVHMGKYAGLEPWIHLNVPALIYIGQLDLLEECSAFLKIWVSNVKDQGHAKFGAKYNVWSITV